MTRKMKHGGCKQGKQDSAYSPWENMRDRCNNKNSTGYHNYGGRGIKVCSRWDDFKKFREDMGNRPPGTSIERNDKNGNYEPGNCRWATPAEQSRNTRKNVLVTLDGETRVLKDWGNKFGLRYNTIILRLKRGWTMEDALFTPKNTKVRYGNQYGVTYDAK